jgi:YD repeat-containing protein
VNRLTNIQDFQLQNFGFGYDTLSRRTSLTRPNGINTAYSYNNVSNLLSVLHQLGTTTLQSSALASSKRGVRDSLTLE